MDTGTIIGTIAACLTTAAFIPQAIKTLKEKSTKDISLLMYSLFVIGIICWLIYGIYLLEWPIIIANGVTLIFATIILIMKLKYG